LQSIGAVGAFSAGAATGIGLVVFVAVVAIAGISYFTHKKIKYEDTCWDCCYHFRPEGGAEIPESVRKFIQGLQAREEQGEEGEEKRKEEKPDSGSGSDSNPNSDSDSGSDSNSHCEENPNSAICCRQSGPLSLIIPVVEEPKQE
jgi:hypothetical protein